MKIKFLIFNVLFSLALLPKIAAQTTFISCSGNGTGKGGSIIYSVGHATTAKFKSSKGEVITTTQRPYALSIVTKSNTPSVNILDIKAYPNPTNQFINISVKSKSYQLLHYELLNHNGKLLDRKQILGSTKTINMESYPSGIYFIDLKENNLSIKVFKITKQ